MPIKWKSGRNGQILRKVQHSKTEPGRVVSIISIHVKRLKYGLIHRKGYVLVILFLLTTLNTDRGGSIYNIKLCS